jgi:hypothetical protein
LKEPAFDDIDRLREKLRKVEALFAGASTKGEQMAASEAIERIKKRLAESGHAQKPVEFKITLADGWSRRLFVALCRRYGLDPYRRRGQRHTTVMIRVPESFVNDVLWPELQELNAALREYLDAATNKIIREEVYKEAGEAPEGEGR